MLFTKSYNFQLNKRKFPVVSILRKKERELEKKIKSAMEKLLSVKKFASQLSLSKGKNQVLEFEGR